MSLQSSPVPRKGKTLGDPVSVGIEHLVDRGRWKRDDPGINRALNFVSQCKSPFSERSFLFKVNGLYRIHSVWDACVLFLCPSGLCLLFLFVFTSTSYLGGRLSLHIRLET